MPENKQAVTVRRARRQDAEAIGNLVVALADYEKLDPPDEAARARLVEEACSSNPRVEIYLAEVSGQVVGYAFFFETYSTFLALPTLYLEDLFVLPEFRGVGAGFALIRALASEAVSRGCGRMEWQVLEWNRPAIDFYERLGAKHLSDWLSYRLDRDELERLTSAG